MSATSLPSQNRPARIVSELAKPVFFVGFMGAGKTSVARKLARTCGIASVDMDTYLERREGKRVRELFAEAGEDAFRAIETDVLRELAEKEPLLVSCGGGAVLRAQNVRALRQNGVVVYIDRPLGQLAVGGARPLSQSAEALAAMHAARAPLYAAACDARVENDGPFESVAEAIKERFYEILDH